MHRSKLSWSWLAALLALALLTACTGAKLPREVVASDGPQGEGLTVDDSATTTPAGPTGDPIGGAAPGATGATAGTKVTTKTGPVTTSPGPALRPGQVKSTLFSAAEDTIGITKNLITLCAHAALTYGAAFNTSDADLNVFWSALNDKGGLFNRRVSVTYENDNYSPDTAVTAATACKAKNPFFILGGIGFDQIPAVRNWAEANRQLYLHHTATVQGTSSQRFSFSGLPTTEKMGQMFGELVAARYRDKKIGVIHRASPNWDPGYNEFMKVARKYGVDVVAERGVQNNQGSYTQELLDLKDKGATVVFGWENALSATQIVKQAKAQNFNPTWLLFPFNLTSQTLDGDALNPKMVGIAMYTAYSNKYYGGSFAAYADDMKEFEAQYAKYRPNADLGGVGGDLLFLNWTAQKGLSLLLQACGPDCTRNRMIDAINGYHEVKPFSSSCEIDFTRPGFARLGSFSVNVMETFRAPDGKVNWRNTDSCVEHLI